MDALINAWIMQKICSYERDNKNRKPEPNLYFFSLDRNQKPEWKITVRSPGPQVNLYLSILTDNLLNDPINDS